MSDCGTGMQHEHSRRFDAIDRRFGDVFNQINELRQDMGTVQAFQERVESDLYNHGKDGLKTLFTQFVSVSNEREAARDRRRGELDRRKSRNLAIAGIAALFILPVSIWITTGIVSFVSDVYKITKEWHEIHKGELQHNSSTVPAEYTARR